MKRTRFHPAARKELVSAVDYYDDRDPDTSEEFQALVSDLLERLAQLPRTAPLWWPRVPVTHEIRRARVSSHPYLVVYAVGREENLIVAIAHTSRLPGYWVERVRSLRVNESR